MLHTATLDNIDSSLLLVEYDVNCHRFGCIVRFFSGTMAYADAKHFNDYLLDGWPTWSDGCADGHRFIGNIEVFFSTLLKILSDAFSKKNSAFFSYSKLEKKIIFDFFHFQMIFCNY